MLLFNLTTFYHDILTFLNVRQCCTNNCRENQLCSFVGLILNLLVHLHKWPPSPMQCSVLMKAEDTACPPAFFLICFSKPYSSLSFSSNISLPNPFSLWSISCVLLYYVCILYVIVYFCGQTFLFVYCLFSSDLVFKALKGCIYAWRVTYK